MPGKEKGKPHAKDALSAAFVRTAKEPGRYSDGRGLMLIVGDTGRKRWMQRLVVHGRRVDIALGDATEVKLAEAREVALANRKLARAGGDPTAEKRREKTIPNFQTAAEDFLAVKLPSLGNEKHRWQWRATLEAHAFPAFGTTRIDQVTTEDVLRAVRPIWATTPETARRLAGRIEAVLQAAIVKGHRKGENPARWKGHLDQLLPRKPKVEGEGRQPAFAADDMPCLLERLAYGGYASAKALTFVALTWARSGEVRGATWGEVDLEARTWTVPASRMKAGREHVVPLSDAAVALLKSIPEGAPDNVIFPSPRGGPLSDMALSAVLRRMTTDDGRPRFTDPKSGRASVPHGLRATARSWAAENGFSRELCERALARQIPDEVERAYQRSDQLEARRALMQAWSDFIMADAPPAKNGRPYNVVKMWGGSARKRA